jgi:tripartite-type tricarboxylate transporter receptor subunit TctC
VNRNLIATVFSVGAVAVFSFAVPAAFAQEFSARPLRIILPFAAGGGTDVFARP